MIRSQDVNKEVKVLDDILKAEKVNDVELMKAVLKGITLLVKLVRDVRTNQVTVMKASNVELIKEDVQKVESDERV